MGLCPDDRLSEPRASDAIVVGLALLPPNREAVRTCMTPVGRASAGFKAERILTLPMSISPPLLVS